MTSPLQHIVIAYFYIFSYLLPVMSTLNLYLAISKEREQDQPRHWILMIAEENATHGIFYHITGGPMHGKPYEVTIEPKRVESHGIDKRHLIAQILEKREG
ncbi:hypothetical protein FACUT_11300 [Fusarium acutatum]|uniref:Uncharacterized protein n=1 Tax=Fusarium acutatum TaxID=78861 RepID=A0A8H4JEJ2_9HYPO|nr:hypothetical protein FACUT_11300 [Fusarium acutatum]